MQAEAEAYLDRLPGQRAEGEQLDLAQDHHEDGVIGITGLSEFSRRDRRAIVGHVVRQAVVGDGGQPRVQGARVPPRASRSSGWTGSAPTRTSSTSARSGRSRASASAARASCAAGTATGTACSTCVIVGMLRDDWEQGPLRDVPVTVTGEPPPAFVLR